jgi:hypothetical protein
MNIVFVLFFCSFISFYSPISGFFIILLYSAVAYVLNIVKYVLCTVYQHFSIYKLYDHVRQVVTFQYIILGTGEQGQFLQSIVIDPDLVA